MSREKEDYRANMERLNELFPDHEMLSIKEAAQVMGFREPRTVKKYVPFSGPSRTVSKASLARIMCGK